MENLSEASVKDLRSFIAERGYSYASLLERHELKARAKEVAAASQQWSAAIHNCPMMECRGDADRSRWATSNPIVIRNGYMKVSDQPGLGVDLDQEYLKANRAEGEPWWG